MYCQEWALNPRPFGPAPVQLATLTNSAILTFVNFGYTIFYLLHIYFIHPTKNVMKKLTMKRKRTVIFAPYDAQSSVEILLDKMATILVVLNAFIV